MSMSITSNGNSSAAHGAPRRILLVDDTADIRLMLRLQLQMSGVSFEEAASGAEALALCDSEQFDLVLLDYRMPGMTGVEVARQLRAGDYPATIVLYSAYVNPTLEVEAKQLDIAVIDKADQERLRETVRAVLVA
jgi:CheY-like chemotaxis protein